MAPRKTTSRKPATKTGTKTAAPKSVTKASARSTTKPATKTTAKTATKTAEKAPARTAAKTPRKTKAKTPAATPVAPVVVGEVKPVATGAALRKKALLEKVTERAGIKRRDAKAAIEAALEVLGEAIADGQEINLPGFGKLKVTRSKTLSNGRVFTTRIRQPLAKPESAEPAKPADNDPLAEAAE